MQRDSNPVVKSVSCVLTEGPANALCLSKDQTHVVVAGRNVFKILAIGDDAFTEKLNLRPARNLNLNYSCNDVAWSPLEENLIATGATNGAVVLWDLTKITRAKQEQVFHDHQRTVHKVVFHPSDPFILLSGSQDGTVKNFDLRAKETKMTFMSNSETVRDVQFMPRNHGYFASVNENGSVQLWDMRRDDRPTLTFAAHTGPVFACDWHPEQSSVLATGGRDRTIKVWTINLSSPLVTLEHTIHTVASVGRIKWRPNRRSHIGSTSLVVDSSVSVWDVRRPYVPFAAFEKHKDVATGIAWKNSPHVLISTSKDCTVWQHVFKDASRPASKAIPQALALNFRRGEISQAIVAPPQAESSSMFQVFKKAYAPDEQFHLAQSVFFSYETPALNGEYFSKECAVRYILWGQSIPDMCENNLQVALSLKLPRIALTWEIAKLFYSTMSLQVPQRKSKVADPVLAAPPKDENDDKYVSDDDAGNNSSSETEKQDYLAEMVSGLHMNHNTFLQQGPTFDLQFQQDNNVIPAEAFQPRHEIREGSSPPIHLEDCAPRDLEDTQKTVAIEIENKTSQLTVLNFDAIPPLELTQSLANALFYHANYGDVQTAVCVWLVLSSLEKINIDRLVLESWCWAYVELLQRYRLYPQAAVVIKHCGVLGHLSQQSTTFLTCCGRCGKPISHRAGNFCEKCKKTAARCGVCHGTVSGLMSWCQGCGHGGHLAHLQSWFSKHKECPTGCSHQCHS